MVGACTAVVDAEEFPQFPHFALPPSGGDPETHFARLWSAGLTVLRDHGSPLQVRAAFVRSQRKIG